MAKRRETHWEGDSTSPEETPDTAALEMARKRAEVLARFLAERPWEKELRDRHEYYLRVKDEEIPAEDLMEFACSLVTGMPHIGRQGYTGPDKPPFDLESADESLLVDAKLFDSGDSKAQNRLKVKHERPRKQFRRWHENGEKAIPCQLARGRRAWFVIPGIPIKDVPLGKAVDDTLAPNNPMKPVRLLDTADITEWNNFERLHAAWSAAISFLRQHQEAVMASIRQKRAEFTEKDARETIASDYERPIWIATALSIPEAKQQIVEQVAQDDEARQQVIEEAFQHEASKQQIVEQAFQDKEAKQQIVNQVFHDDEVMREQLGEELYLLWKARQQSGGSAATP